MLEGDGDKKRIIIYINLKILSYSNGFFVSMKFEKWWFANVQEKKNGSDWRNEFVTINQQKNRKIVWVYEFQNFVRYNTAGGFFLFLFLCTHQ